MDLKLKEKYALITGGGHGIGKAIALGLAEEGCNVAICALNKKQIEGTVREIKEKGVEAIGTEMDITSSENIGTFMKTVIDSWGKIDILVNNVGGGGTWGSPVVEETPENVWLDVYNKNALAAIRFTMKAIPYMKKQKWGRVITIASRLGREGGGRPWFNMAKSAEISLMKTLAMNPSLAREGITFNSIAPGAIIIPDTGWEKMEQENPTKFKEFTEQLPLGRLGTPEEVASLVVFLCSERTNLINGACLAVDGAEGSSF